MAEELDGEPRRLYKYRSVASLGLAELLGEGKLYLSHFRDLNDPFECRPIVKKPSKRVAEKYLKFLTGPRAEELGYAAKRFDDRLKLRRQARATLSNSDVMRENLEFVMQQCGVYSLSACRNNLLLWAHYADAHCGLCVGFERSVAGVQFAMAEDVHYASTRPIVRGEATMYGEKGIREAIVGSILTKSADWTYEEEYRIVSREKFGYVDYRREDLSEIILGAQMRRDDSARVARAVGERVDQVEFFQARLSDEAYKLEFDRLDASAVAKLVDHAESEDLSL